MNISRVACILVAGAAGYAFSQAMPFVRNVQASLSPQHGGVTVVRETDAQAPAAAAAREPAGPVLGQAAAPLPIVVASADPVVTASLGLAAMTADAAQQEAPGFAADEPRLAALAAPQLQQTRFAAPEDRRVDFGPDTPTWEDHYPVPAQPQAQQDLSYLADYAYSEVPAPRKPADVVLAALKDIPLGTPVEEIERASEALGLDPTFMEAVAKIESDFNPTERTGSYIGLYQLSQFEFRHYGSGDILNPRDNAVAAALKFAVAAKLFELTTHKKATMDDLYLIHQQGTQGAAEHVAHPERLAWQSMCATEEGRSKGEKWCKRAIWGNTLPSVKQAWKSVDKLTSGAFVEMWHERVEHFYSRYADSLAQRYAQALVNR